MKTDLDRLFENLDRPDAPVSWRDVKRRRPGPRISEPERPNRLVTIGVALAIGSAGTFLALRTFVFARTQPIASSSSTPSDSSQSPTASPPPPGWVVHTEVGGVSIDTPASWTFNSDPVPALAEPAMLFAAGTGAVPTGGDCAPRPAIDALPTDGALFALQEYASVDEPYTFPLRPGHFYLGPLKGPFECFGVKAHEVEFQDGGRFFQVFAMFGADAPASLRQQVERSLNSLRVNPLPASAQPSVACRRGPWTSCPEAAWLYQVINRAHVFHLGHSGVHAILGRVAKRSFALWTTSSTQGVPIGQCRSVAGAKVCQVGTRLAWTAQGLLVWVGPAPSPYPSLHTKPGLPQKAALEALVRASESVRLTSP
jgi:hypothetical protein